MEENKTNNKTKYFKIILIIVFVLFVAFVVLRKISIDNQSQVSEQKTTAQPKNEISKVSENDKKRIEKLLEDNTDIKSNDIKDEFNLKVQKNQIKEQFKNDSLVNNQLSKTNEAVETIEKNEVKENIASIETKKSEELKERKIVNEAVETLKETIVEVVKDDVKPKTIENIDMKFINDIHDLKLIKNEIKIYDEKFEYKNSEFKVGDKFGLFEVVKIEAKKIRFKKSEHFFYNLRFY